jgi:hypothetical protein
MSAGSVCILSWPDTANASTDPRVHGWDRHRADATASAGVRREWERSPVRILIGANMNQGQGEISFASVPGHCARGSNLGRRNARPSPGFRPGPPSSQEPTRITERLFDRLNHKLRQVIAGDRDTRGSMRREHHSVTIERSEQPCNARAHRFCVHAEDAMPAELQSPVQDSSRFSQSRPRKTCLRKTGAGRIVMMNLTPWSHTANDPSESPST